MTRWLALVLAMFLLAGGKPAAAHDGGDFIDEMTIPLAVDPATAAVRADREIAAHRARENQVHLGAAHWVRAQAAFRLGDVEAARAHLDAVRRLRITGQAGRRIAGYTELLQGLLERAAGNYAGAFNDFRSAQRHFIGAGDQRGQGLALQSVGVLYSDVGNGQGAIGYFELAKEAYGGDDVFFLSLYNNIGVAYQSSNRFDESNVSLVKALGYARRLDVPAFVSRITLNIAFNQVFARDLASADRTLDELERTAAELSDFDRREILHLRAQIAYERRDLRVAVGFARQALAGADPAASDSSFWKAHQVAYRIFRAAGLQRDALVQLEAVRRLDEEAAKLTASNRAALLSAQFQFDAQQTQIAQLKAETLEQEVSFQRTMTATIIAASLLALGLLGGLLVTAIRARNRERADGAELRLVNQRLEQALAAKTEFLASTSHELRTPLNGILGMTQILLADREIALRHRTQVELLHDAGTTMRSLVDDILDVAKIEHGGFTISPRPTDVEALLRRTARLFDAQAADAGLSLTVMVDVANRVGLVDPDRLTQILFNLVGNAIKFTHDGGVDVTLREDGTGEGQSATLQLAVRDTGIGIAAEWHDGVFDMFRQVDGARTRNYGGTGLGLAICRQLARAMGGDIALASAPGEGSTFTVTLPWIPVTAGVEDATGDREGSRASDATVTVVAADPMRAAMLAAMVRHAGGQPQIADTADALALLSPDGGLTLLVDGPAWPATEPALARRGTTDTVILVGGRGGERDMIGAGGAGIEHVPFTRNAVIDALARAGHTPRSAELPLRNRSTAANGHGEASGEPNRPQLLSQF